MVLLCAIWGVQQVAIKAVSADAAPILQVSLRSAVAAVIVGALTVFRNERPSLKTGRWKPGLLVGILFAMEYLLVGEGLRYTTASHSVMFLYTAPIFAALGLHLRLPSERLKAVQWAGIVIALVGVGVAFAGRGGSSTNMLLGDTLALMGGMSWGATTVTLRLSSLSSAPVTETLLYQLIGGFLVLLTAATAFGQTAFHPSPQVFASLAFQTFVISFASFLVWFAMLRRYLASRLGVLSFMTPLFGIAYGVVLLHEPLDAGFLAGSMLVVLGIVLVSGYGWLTSARSA